MTKQSPQLTEAENELRKILDVRPFMKTRRMEQVLSWHLAQLQALKQALPRDYRPERYNVDACLNHKHYTGACVGCQRQKTRVYTLTEVETLIDTYIARIGGEK